MSVTLHTSLGDLKIDLLCRGAPRLCENFLALCACGLYDGTAFHRVIAGFVAQGGDPTGTGKGGASISGEALADEWAPGATHGARGVVAMASGQVPNNSSQFFITFAPAAHLDGTSCIIGRVVGGASVLDALEAVPVAGKKHRPVDPVCVERVTVHSNPFAR